MFGTERRHPLSIETQTIGIPSSIPSLVESMPKLFNEIHSPISEQSPVSEENFNMKSFSHIQKEDLHFPTSEREAGVRETICNKNTLKKAACVALTLLGFVSTFYTIGACADYTPGLDSEREDVGTPAFIASSIILDLGSALAAYYIGKQINKKEVLESDPSSPIDIIVVSEDVELPTRIMHSNNPSISLSSRIMPPLEKISEDDDIELATPRNLKLHRQNEEQDVKMRASTLEIRPLKEEEHEKIMTALEELLKEVQILLRENVPTLTEKDITLILADPTPTEKPAEIETRNSIMKVFKQRRISENFDIINVIRRIQQDKNNRDRDSIKKSIIHLVNTYIKPGSPRQVNISADLINKILSLIQTVFPDIVIKKNNNKEDQTLFPNGIIS